MMGHLRGRFDVSPVCAAGVDIAMGWEVEMFGIGKSVLDGGDGEAELIGEVCFGTVDRFLKEAVSDLV